MQKLACKSRRKKEKRTLKTHPNLRENKNQTKTDEGATKSPETKKQ